MAANDQILLVVFRGTKELTDWTTNLKFALRSAPQEWGIEEGCDLHRVRMIRFTLSHFFFPSYIFIPEVAEAGCFATARGILREQHLNSGHSEGSSP